MAMKFTHPIRQFAGYLLLALSVMIGTVAENSAAENEGSSDSDIVVVVSRQNSTSEVSRDHVADIFLGRTQQFPDGRRAVPIDQAEGSAVRERFNMEILERTSAQVRSYWSRILFTGRGRPPRSVATSEDVLRILASDPQAIGYIERRFVSDAVTVVLEE